MQFIKPIAITLAIFLTIIPDLTGQIYLDWDYYDIATDIRESGANPDFIIDPAGNKHVSYWRQAEDKLIYGFQLAGSGNWEFEYVDDLGMNGFQSALAVDNNGEIHLAYFENISAQAEIRFAKRNGPNDWTYEVLPKPAKGIGEYDAASSNNNTIAIKPELDLAFDAQNNPKIVFFNAYYNPFLVGFCEEFFLDYEFRPYNAWRTDSTGWQINTFGEYGDKHLTCDGVPLPEGDRYGEFATILIDGNGDQLVITNSYFNREIIMLKSLGNDSTWSLTVLDSAENVFTVIPLGVQYHTLESVSASLGSDGAIHVAFSSSFNYGRSPETWLDRYHSTVYLRVEADTVRQNVLFPLLTSGKPYLNNTSITSIGTDTVLMTYDNMDAGEVIYCISADSGNTWIFDTLHNSILSAPSPLAVYGDSVYVMVYDFEADILKLYQKHLGNQNWTFQVLSFSEKRAVHLDGGVFAGPSDTLIQFAFDDNNRDILYFTTGTQNGIITWNTEQLDTLQFDFDGISFDHSADGTPFIVYTAGDSGDLKLAMKSGGVWSYEIIDSAARAPYSDIVVSANDTLHIVYYSLVDQGLHYAKKEISGSNWNFQIIDTLDPVVGEYPDMAVDNQENVHVSFHKNFPPALHYAKSSGNGIWQTDTVHADAAMSVGKYSSIALGQDGLPKIAYPDDFGEALLIAELDSSGQWKTSVLDSTPAIDLAQPCVLKIDDKGNPWVAYNNFSGYNWIGLLNRDSEGINYYSVSPFSQVGQLGQAFAFEMVGDDLYIMSKKNQVKNSGVAVTTTRDAVTVSIEGAVSQTPSTEILNFPNPFSRTTTFLIQIPVEEKYSLSLYTLQGELIGNVLDNSALGKGTHKLAFDAEKLSSGVYVYKLESKNISISKKLIVIN